MVGATPGSTGQDVLEATRIGIVEGHHWREAAHGKSAFSLRLRGIESRAIVIASFVGVVGCRVLLPQPPIPMLCSYHVFRLWYICSLSSSDHGVLPSASTCALVLASRRHLLRPRRKSQCSWHSAWALPRHPQVLAAKAAAWAWASSSNSKATGRSRRVPLLDPPDAALGRSEAHAYGHVMKKLAPQVAWTVDVSRLAEISLVAVHTSRVPSHRLRTPSKPCWPSPRQCRTSLNTGAGYDVILVRTRASCFRSSWADWVELVQVATRTSTSAPTATWVRIRAWSAHVRVDVGATHRWPRGPLFLYFAQFSALGVQPRPIRESARCLLFPAWSVWGDDQTHLLDCSVFW